jgi:thioredoxin reductase (NADPH)
MHRKGEPIGMDNKVYDVIIVGGGPAGLSAAIYTGRALLPTLVIERGLLGGQAVTTEAIANYPGFVEEITGPELMMRMEQQAQQFGAEFITANVDAVDLEGDIKTVIADGKEYKGRTLIITAGAAPNKLNIPGEERFTGAGVSYCATCDGAFFMDKRVYVIGGGDSAIQEALYLTKFAEKVTVVHRRDQLRATKVVQEKAFANPKIDFIWDSVLVEIAGSSRVDTVRVKNVKTEEITELPADGVFIYVGITPNTAIIPESVSRNGPGYIVTDDHMSTSVPGVFAAGDVRQKLLRQIVTAVSDGATAAIAAEKYLEDH